MLVKLREKAQQNVYSEILGVLQGKVESLESDNKENILWMEDFKKDTQKSIQEQKAFQEEKGPIIEQLGTDWIEFKDEI